MIYIRGESGTSFNHFCTTFILSINPYIPIVVPAYIYEERGRVIPSLPLYCDDHNDNFITPFLYYLYLVSWSVFRSYEMTKGKKGRRGSEFAVRFLKFYIMLLVCWVESFRTSIKTPIITVWIKGKDNNCCCHCCWNRIMLECNSCLFCIFKLHKRRKDRHWKVRDKWMHENS